MIYDTEQINTLIKNRRSIYPNMYSNQKVEDKVIEKMLENANWAPTHKLTQPWRFIVFTGEGLNQLANFQANLYKAKATKEGHYDPKKDEKLKNKPLLASHVIAIAMSRDPKERIPEVEEIESVACAVQNMYLTATAYGVGCYWGSGGITYFEEAKPFFGLAPKDKLLGFLYIGYPKSDQWPKGNRSTYQDKVTWVTS